MRLSTKTALVLAAFAVVCVGGTGGYLYTLSRTGYQEVVLDRQTLLVSQAAAQLHQQLQLAIEKLDRMAHMSEVDLTDDDDGPERRLLSEAWRLGLFFSRGTIELLDARGLCHGAEPEHDACIGRSYADAPWFAEGRAARAPTLRIRPRPGQNAVLGFFVPIRDRNALVGILHGELEFSRSQLLEDAAADTTFPPEMLIVVNEAAEVLHQEGTADLHSAVWRSVLEGIDDQPSGARRIVLADGDRAFAWAPVGDTGTTMIESWQWGALDPHADERLEALFVAAIVLAFVGVALGMLLAGRINEPVLALARDVQRVQSEGRPLAPGEGSDEIQELRTAFVSLVSALEEREGRARRDRDRIAELADTLEERVRDRTQQLEQAQQDLVRAERLAALGSAGAALSHEIRNSLNGLSVGMDALESLDGPARAKVRKHVRAEIGRLLLLADALLDLARPRTLKAERVGVAGLLERCAFLIEEDAAERGVSVEVVDLCEGGDVPVDEVLIQSALVNLLRNAVEAVEGKGERVRITAQFVDETWRVDVDDDGPGVANHPDGAPLADRIFEPFVSGRSGGVGLGLAISQRFVQLHGGQLELVPGVLGGACFRLTLPLRAPETSNTPAEESKA